MKGSMTVEAALIYPFCFMAILIVCYLGIFQYNQTVLKLTGYESVLQTVNQWEGSEEYLQEELIKNAEALAKQRVLGMKTLETEVKITALKIVISFQGNQGFLNLPIKVSADYERCYPELTLRLLSGKMGESDEGNFEERSE